MRHTLLFLHLAGAIAWVGGMFFAYFCLRPAAARLLQPPQRLPLWAATFGRFLPLAAVAVALILASGFAMLLQVGFAAAPPGWHLMLALGLVMAAVFVSVYAVFYPRLKRHCDAAAWPAAAAALNRIRQLVGANLVLAVLVVAAAVSAR
ncbi:MAG: CopD family protein [Pseudomonadota bacterium]